VAYCVALILTGHVNCVKVILDAAAPSHSDNIITNLADPRGQTPLHVACEIGRADCVELLLMHGANMCALESTQDRNAIHISASAGQRYLAKRLLASKAHTMLCQEVLSLIT
jgi:ankyrin repeat protein